MRIDNRKALFGDAAPLDQTYGNAAVRASALGQGKQATWALRERLKSGARLGFHVYGNSFDSDSNQYFALMASSRGRLYQVANSAVAGTNSNVILAKMIAEGFSPLAEAVMFGEGTNDAAQGVSLVQHRSNMRTMAQLVLDAGKVPVMRLTPPSDRTGAEFTKVIENWIADFMLCEDMGIPFVDNFARQADVDGSWLPGVSGDAVHPYTGYYTQGGHDYWDQLQNGGEPLLLPRTNVGHGVVGSNVLQLTDTNADNLPDGWALLGLTGHTINARTDYAYPYRGKKASISVSQTADGYVYRDSIPVTAGKLVRVSGVFGLASAVNIVVAAFVRFVGTGLDVYLGNQAASGERYFCSDMVVPAGATSAQIYYRTRSATTGAYSGTISWGAVDVYDVAALLGN